MSEVKPSISSVSFLGVPPRCGTPGNEAKISSAILPEFPSSCITTLHHFLRIHSRLLTQYTSPRAHKNGRDWSKSVCNYVKIETGQNFPPVLK